jgi:hypothetical protein
VARSGAEALARREYRGLEPRLGEHAPARVVEGLAGIASSFAGEGTRRVAATALLENGGDAVAAEAEVESPSLTDVSAGDACAVTPQPVLVDGASATDGDGAQCPWRVEASVAVGRAASMQLSVRLVRT